MILMVYIKKILLNIININENQWSTTEEKRKIQTKSFKYNKKTYLIYKQVFFRTLFL